MTDHRRLAGIIVGLALLARIAAAVALGSSFHFADGSAYVDTARRLLSGDGFGAGYQRVPAYPVLLAVLAAPLPAGLVLWRVAQAVLTATGCVLLYLLVSQMFGAVPALVAALLYALDPVLIVASGLLYPEAITAAPMIPTILSCDMRPATTASTVLPQRLRRAHGMSRWCSPGAQRGSLSTSGSLTR